MRNLLEQLRQVADCMKQSGSNTALKYASIHEFVLKYGKPFQYASPDPRWGRGKPKQCFENSARLAALEGFVYVEGFGTIKDIGLAIHHAWVVQPDTNIVIDITTNNIDNYFGVPFTHASLRHHWKHSDSASMIDDWSNDWPMLRASEGEIRGMLASVPDVEAPAPVAVPITTFTLEKQPQ